MFFYISNPSLKLQIQLYLCLFDMENFQKQMGFALAPEGDEPMGDTLVNHTEYVSKGSLPTRVSRAG